MANLSEEDTKRKHITPAIEQAGWKDDMYSMEFPITAGQVIVQGALKTRKKSKKADYMLFAHDNDPIAVVEAKSTDHAAADGLQQAMDYAELTDVKFAYSSNGQEFVEHDFTTGSERYFKMNKFPTLQELVERREAYRQLSAKEQAIVNVPYYFDTVTQKRPRYYQRKAINRTVEAVARGQKRILLVMATGTGKTYTAFQIVYRLRRAGCVRKVLYLADRNVLIDQTMLNDFKPFDKTMTKVQGKDADGSYEIYMSLYGQWVNYEEGARQPYEDFRPDFFDLIIVDECHRSSVKEDSEWKKILNYFSEAIQIGMTATPKDAEGASNIDYFGPPVYVYSLKQGIEDGFLAPYRVTRSFLSVDLEGYIPEPDEVDLDGQRIEQDLFVRSDIGRTLRITQREIIVARRITEMLKVIGPMTKTIVFCPETEDALKMRELLIQMNPELCRKYPNYVVRITSDDRVGKKLLEDFQDVNSPTPVIATTSMLLETGVDCKTCGLIVIDKEVNSMTSFKQMVGRGTRILEEKGKLSFEILDFRNVTRLFQDPEFDGEADRTTSYSHRRNEDEAPVIRDGNDIDGEEDDEKRKKYRVNGRDIRIVHEHVLHLGPDGKTLTTESLTDFTRKAIRDIYPSLNAFVGAWAKADRKQLILDELKEEDVLLEAVRQENPKLREVDDFDLICHVAFDQKPLTRRERAENVRKRNYLAKYSPEAQKVLNALLDKYAETTRINLEDTKVLELNPFDKMGKKPFIMKKFGTPDKYRKAISELIRELYEVG